LFGVRSILLERKSLHPTKNFYGSKVEYRAANLHRLFRLGRTITGERTREEGGGGGVQEKKGGDNYLGGKPLAPESARLKVGKGIAKEEGKHTHRTGHPKKKGKPFSASGGNFD